MDRGRTKTYLGLLFIVLGIAWFLFFYGKPTNFSEIGIGNFSNYLRSIILEFGGVALVIIGLFLLLGDALSGSEID
jgi:hypothetical protein